MPARWSTASSPDFLRLKAALTGSEELRAEAIVLAREQGALALELRAATALARAAALLQAES